MEFKPTVAPRQCVERYLHLHSRSWGHTQKWYSSLTPTWRHSYTQLRARCLQVKGRINIRQQKFQAHDSTIYQRHRDPTSHTLPSVICQYSLLRQICLLEP
jgi:hypothetical protein